MRQKLDDDTTDLVRMFPLPQPRHLATFFNQRWFFCFYYLCSLSLLYTCTNQHIPDRAPATGETTKHPAAGYGYRPSLSQAILHQSAYPIVKPISRNHNCDISSL